ncbi:MAG: class II glutamine amidotransferase [Candidatus Njordarchaeia archaeon]
MCELFGLSANKNVGVSYIFDAFKSGSIVNRHGWGLAWFNNGKWGMIKEPFPALKSKRSGTIGRSVSGEVFVGHIRYATEGDVRFVNTHPFIVEVNGVEWVFAHNGDVGFAKSAFELSEFNPLGDTDSEFAFLVLMENLKKLDPNPSLRDTIAMIYNLSLEISNFGTFNFLLSNGKYIFAFSDGNLHYVTRRSPFPESVIYRGEGIRVNLNEVKGSGDIVTIVATVPLTIGEKWVKIPSRKLLIIHDGVIALEYFDEQGFKPHLSNDELEILKFVRKQPHSVKIREIANKFSSLEARELVKKLVDDGYLCIDSRDRGKNELDKRVYTEPRRREIIKLLISN